MLVTHGTKAVSFGSVVVQLCGKWLVELLIDRGAVFKLFGLTEQQRALYYCCALCEETKGSSRVMLRSTVRRSGLCTIW